MDGIEFHYQNGNWQSGERGTFEAGTLDEAVEDVARSDGAYSKHGDGTLWYADQVVAVRAGGRLVYRIPDWEWAKLLAEMDEDAPG